MPINKGGNKTKRKKRNYGRYEPIDKIKSGQMFGKIEHNNGDHFVVLCSDNVKRVANITNTIRKGPRLNKDTYVVVTPTDKGGCSIEGIGNPSNDIIKLFKSNDPKGDIGIEFYDSDDNEDDLIKNKNKKKVNENQSDIMNLPPNEDSDDDFDDFYGNTNDNQEYLVDKSNNDIIDELDDELGILPSRKDIKSDKSSKYSKSSSTNLKTPVNIKKNLIDKIMDEDSDEDINDL